jgi:hypothetical protein
MSSTYYKDNEVASSNNDQFGKPSMTTINRTSALAFVGWILFSTGVLGSLSTKGAAAYTLPLEPVYHIAYHAITIAAFSLVARRHNLASYKLAVMALLAIGFNYVTDDMQWSIIAYGSQRSSDKDDPKHFGEVALSGTSLLIIAWLAMIITMSRSASN